ncbi:hypothetical protein [Geothrix sp. SG200]|uniref:hypothetical protein n=1 Tax=Geothrix sp. SG200 TaxID=2922865 RepID=UPI001FAD131E|nr:hypothetical protein [Geothrix sp. SG200]
MIRRFGQMLLAALVLLCSPPLLADGFPLKDGRYAGGPVIEMKLTKSQAKSVSNHFEPGMLLKLTRAQQRLLKSKGKMVTPPTELMIFHATDLAQDCTCFAANWAFDFKPGWLEVPLAYLCTDQEAIDQRPAD